MKRQWNFFARVIGLLVGISLFISCEVAGSPQKNIDSIVFIDRGKSVLLQSQVSANYQFNVDLSGFNPISSGALDPSQMGSYLFDQNILLVPIFSRYNSGYLYTKYNGKYEDPRTHFGMLDPNRIKIPFDIPSIDYSLVPIDCVEIDYFIIDGQAAFDDFQKQVGLVNDPLDTQKCTFYSQLANVSNLSVVENEATLICLIKQKVFRVSRKSDTFSQDFLSRRQLLGVSSQASFYDDYGDTTCTSVELGGYLYLKNNFYYKDSPNTLEEIRTALLEYASSFFNLSGVKPLSEKTTKVMKTIQGTLPYTLANSGAINSVPSFPTTNEFPQLLKDFTEKMKDGKNLWSTELVFRKY